MKLEDLKAYDLVDDVPDADLCFYKCFYEKIDFIDDNGKIETHKLELIPEIQNIDSSYHNKLITCIKELDPIEECQDLKKIGECFRTL